MKIKAEHVVIGVLLLLVASYYGYINLPFGAQPVTTGTGQVGIQTTDACLAGCFGQSSATVNVRTKHWVNNSNVIATATQQFFNLQDNPVVAATTLDASPTDTASLPICFNGYIITGDDDGTAPDYYWMKTTGVSWQCPGTFDFPYDVKVALESGVTYTGYDDGTSESTWNITVGTTKVTSAELKIESAKGACIGNPSIPRPLGICINGSSTTIAKFNEIKPTGITKTFTSPSYLSSLGSVLACYELPTEALCDGQFYRFYLTIDPVSDPAAGEVVYIHLMDKTYYLNDDQVYVIGWEDSSDLVADADIGITNSNKALNFA